MQVFIPSTKSIQDTNVYLSTKLIDNQNTENYNKENELLIYLLTNYNLLIERSFQMTVNPRLQRRIQL